VTKPRKWRGPVPPCDFCKDNSRIISVFFDAATTYGPWAIMCGMHYRQVGLPMGQEYRRVGDEWVKSCNLNGQPDRPTLDDENAEMERAEREEKS
jgi:hypothetical protein